MHLYTHLHTHLWADPHDVFLPPPHFTLYLERSEPILEL